MPASQDVARALPTFLLRKAGKKNVTGEVELRVHPRATEVGKKKSMKKHKASLTLLSD